MARRLGRVALAAALTTVVGCDGEGTDELDGALDGGGDPDGGADGAPGDAEDEGSGDAGDDGGGGMHLEEVALVATSVSFTADRLCDLDGDGAEDNAFAELGEAGAVSATMLWSSLGEAALSEGYGPGIFFPVLNDGGESRLAALSGDGTALGGVLRAPYESMDQCGEPLFHYRGELVADGQLSVTAEAYPLLLSDAVAVGAARVTGVVVEGPEGISIETEECLAPTIADLGATMGPTQTRQMTLLEVLLAGGGVLGVAGAPGLSPDLDLDGDGLERLVIDDDGRIARCVDGDDTVVEGRDCWSDERMADGFALTRRVTYERAAFEGRFEGWMGFCPGGYPDPSLFGSGWVVSDRRQIAVGASHACIREGDGSIRCWGDADEGQLGYGHGAAIGDDEPACAGGLVEVGEGTLGIMASGDITCAILQERRVRCWGNLSEELPNIGDDETPAGVPTLEIGAPVQQIVAGFAHFCALLSGGRVRCWLLAPDFRALGYGYDCDEYDPSESRGAVGGAAPADCGALGHGNTEALSVTEAALAADVPVGARVAALAAGKAHVCALLEGGAVRCWGRGAEGALGHGDTENVGDDETPEDAGDVDVGGRAVAITAGDYHSCALLEGGAVRCWGRGAEGALGYGNTSSVGDDETPADAGNVPLAGSAVAIAAGRRHTCALLAEGTVRCWGRAIDGQLGYGSEETVGDDETPAEAGDVAVGAAVVAIAAGRRNTCAILDDDEVRCWGSEALGYGVPDAIGDDEAPESAGDVPLDCAAAICGDGRTEVLEACDDGNVEGADGCDPSCRVEAGYVCDDGDPATCHPIRCGDGLVEGDERCDDGAADAGDGCSAGCQVELGYECDRMAEPTTCALLPYVDLGTFAPGEAIPAQVGGPLAGDEVDYYMIAFADDVALTGTAEAAAGAPTFNLAQQASETRFWTETCTGSAYSRTNRLVTAGQLLVGVSVCEDVPAYTLTLSTISVVCGDGVVTEPCDDGNLTAGDGCSSECTVEVGWSCAVPSEGAASECVVTCTGDRSTLVSGVASTGDTTGLDARHGGSCGGAGPEVIYDLEVPALSDVTISTVFPATDADTVVYVRSDCGDPATELGCNDDDDFFGRSHLELSSVPPGTYSVFVDSYGTSDAGAFEVLATVTPL